MRYKNQSATLLAVIALLNLTASCRPRTIAKPLSPPPEHTEKLYPTKWQARGTDANIDHRRVPNLQTYFTRKGKSLATTGDSGTFLPGDIVTWDLGDY